MWSRGYEGLPVINCSKAAASIGERCAGRRIRVHRRRFPGLPEALLAVLSTTASGLAHRVRESATATPDPSPAELADLRPPRQSLRMPSSQVCCLLCSQFRELNDTRLTNRVHKCANTAESAPPTSSPAARARGDPPAPASGTARCTTRHMQPRPPACRSPRSAHRGPHPRGRGR